jgi:hypothetical protein
MGLVNPVWIEEDESGKRPDFYGDFSLDKKNEYLID